MIRKAWCVILFLSLLVGCKPRGTHPLYHIEKSAISSKGMVVTSHPLASEIGLEILKIGGNAADAAIAIQFALAVVYPRAGNLGGGGFMIYRTHDGKVLSLDYREQAPSGATREMFLDSAGQVIQTLSKTGMLAAGIPGTVAGLYETHQKLGKLQPWSSLVEPAIRLAAKGFRITPMEAARLNANRQAFEENNAHAIPFLKDSPWIGGDRLVQKELENTLRLIAEKGPAGFYAGTHARQLEFFSTQRKGIITAADLGAYKPVWRQPIRIPWREYTVFSMGLPSSGGILLQQILSMVEGKLNDSFPHHHAANMHLLIEAERRAFEDRARYLGDADFFHVPVDSITSETYLVDRFINFDPSTATESIHPDSLAFRLSKESFETTHFCVVDAEGNAASVTTTLNDNYGCKIWFQGGGYFLNNEMDDFSVKPGEPNMYGLMGAEANAIFPGKRMLSAMTPTIIEKNGKLWMVAGTNGGPTIITSVLQVFLNVAVFDMSINEAVDAPRYHHQWLPDEIMYEKNGFSPTLLDELQSMGHQLKPLDYIGFFKAILVDSTGMIHGAGDQRAEDHAAGW